MRLGSKCCCKKRLTQKNTNGDPYQAIHFTNGSKNVIRHQRISDLLVTSSAVDANGASGIRTPLCYVSGLDDVAEQNLHPFEAEWKGRLARLSGTQVIVAL